MGCAASTDAGPAGPPKFVPAPAPMTVPMVKTSAPPSKVSSPRSPVISTPTLKGQGSPDRSRADDDKPDGVTPKGRLGVRRASIWSLTDALQSEGLLQDGRYPEAILQRHLNDLNIVSYHGATLTPEQLGKLLEAVSKDEEMMRQVRETETAQLDSHRAERARWAVAKEAACAAHAPRFPPADEAAAPPAEKAAFLAKLRRIAQGSFKDAKGLENRPESWLYVSSGFGDTEAERSYLQEFVFPDLMVVAEELGVSFNPVDLRWGVENDLSDNHNFAQICMAEVERCLRSSPGITFLKLSGQRYSGAALPKTVLASDFEKVLPHVKDPLALQAMQHWYRKDENAVPEEYVLQRSSVAGAASGNPLPRFADDPAKGARGAQSVMLDALKAAVAASGLGGGKYEEWLLSVANRELLTALDQKINPDPRASVLLTVRTLEGIEAETGPLAATYRSDGEERELLLAARNRMAEAVGADRVITHAVPWAPGGVSLATHGDYVRSMGAKVFAALEESLRHIKARAHALNATERELVSTATFVHRRAHTFLGRQELFKAAMQLVAPSAAAGGHVKVMHGRSGMGKTSLLCAVAYGSTGIKVLRKCGYNWGASSATALLAGLCGQLKHALGTEDVLPHELQGLTECLSTLLTHAKAEAPISVFIDSLDLLSDEDGGRTDPWKWLPTSLPPHVAFVVSTGPDDLTRGLGLLRSLKGGLSDADLLEVPPVPPEEAQDQLAKWLHGAGRKVTNRQWQELTSAIADSKSGRPILYLKLLYDASVRWQSTQPLTRVHRSVSGLIDELFAKLEVDHGQLLVSRTLGLLCASKNGLSEANLMDLISASDDILCWKGVKGGVLQHYSPELRRIPPLMFKRLVYALREYLVERIVGNATVLVFFHRQFKEQAERRYISSDPMRQFLCRFLAGYFTGDLAAHYLRRGIASHFCTKVMPDGRSAVVRSAQALSELAAALLRSGALFHTELLATLCDLDAIEAKVSGGLLDELIADMAEALVQLRAEGPPGTPSSAARGTPEERRLHKYHMFLLDNAHLIREDPGMVRQLAAL